jgi:hypothetical protein
MTPVGASREYPEPKSERPSPALPASVAAATDDLMDGVEAAWRTLASCRPFMEEELAPSVTAAMACLEEVAQLGSALPPHERRPWIDEVREIEEMARAIEAHLRAEERE